MIRNALFAVACVFGIGCVPAAAQSGTDAILVLDASGSMWGQVEGQTKIAAARQAVDTILSRWRPSDRLGLMAYGHRTKGDCRDIELIAPVSRVDPAAIKATVAKLNPRGKTPLAASLREAAAILKHTEAKATVILVSDGIETCDPDPCAAAAELEKTGVGFTAHVVGFAITDPVAKAQLQCIARATGGVYLDAKNASGLDGALTKVAQAAQGGRVTSEAPAKPRDPLEGKNLRATARLAENADPLGDERIAWDLHQPDADGKAGHHVVSEYGARLAMVAKPGTYVLKVVYGQVERQFPVTIEDAKRPVTLDLVLDAGFVTSEGAIEGGARNADGLAWEVFTPGGEHIASDYAALPTFILPAGDYVMRLSRGNSVTQRSFSLAAGDSINLAMSLSLGRLVVDALYAPRGPKVEDGLTVEVRRPAKALGEEGESITVEYQPRSIFELPAGDYDILAQVGSAPKTVRATVKSGETTQVTVEMNAGIAAINAPGATFLEIFEARTAIDGTRRSLVVDYDGELQATLPAGDYVLVSEKAGTPQPEQGFTVKAGERTDVTVR